MNQNDLDWFAARLAIAVYDTRRESAEMSLASLKAVLIEAGIEGAKDATITGNVLSVGDRHIEIGPMASNDEIKAALQNPFVPTLNTKVTMSKSPLRGLGQKIGLEVHNATLDAAKISAKVDELAARRQAAVPKVIEGLEAQGKDTGELEAFVTELEQATNQ